MRRLQKVAVLAIAVGSLSGVGAGVGVADSATPDQSQTIAQPPAAPAQIGLQQFAPTQNAPQTSVLQQAAPLQAVAAPATDAEHAVTAAPRQVTTQGFGHTALAPAEQLAGQPAAVVGRDTQSAPQTVMQSALQTSPEGVLRATPQGTLETAQQVASRPLVSPQTAEAPTAVVQQAAPQLAPQAAPQDTPGTASQNVLQAAPHAVNNVFSLTQ
ncbi:hypothetical protein [Streptomyces odontomachi]|uniref:hypothetical protein n=1 Tax=Streptomyces odontomachi TaxID=2944940 RepID=UPI00210CE1DE|nr:hypothetical protein [Streptomyces sp. ODS25]